ncbi:unnamed protein product [Ceutorhynchus assimilis]|uniref:RING-type E3 ubiquitin transferase n=1 Tax=Ceutorhynchus assimilis TaxID=467358 RepID=A0A9N9MWX7_9CUCU|nr:unnamed protein product [Ceutorhynchus assimilis]
MDNSLHHIFDSPRRLKICHKAAYPITEKDHKLERVILKEYECPVCINYASPPIMMCSNSHIICLDCWKRCISCPTCRAPKTLSRAFTLEKIHPLLSFPCKWDGCCFRATSSYTIVHEHVCKYYPLKCPLGESHQCTWMGTMENVQEHLGSCHRDNVYFQSSVYLMSTNFATASRKYYTIILVVNDRLFKFSWTFDTAESLKVRFGMVSIGNGIPLDVYNYTLMFAKQFPVNNSRIIKVHSQVKKSFNDCSVINRDPNSRFDEEMLNLEMDYEDLVRQCTSAGTLMYQLRIEVDQMTKFNRSYRFHGIR